MQRSSKKVGVAPIVISVILIGFMFVPMPDYLAGKNFLSAVSHHFWHLNWFHLGANILALWLALSRRGSMSELLFAWAIASLSIIVATRPVIGFSNWLFAIAGLRSADYNSSYWRQPATIVFLLTMVAMCFFEQFSATTHIASFLIGVFAAIVVKAIKETKDYYGRATRK